VTILQERHRGMHRYSDEDVAAVVLAAVAELRRRRDRAAVSRRWERAAPGLLAQLTARVRLIRLGRLPREQYEAAAGPDDPPYQELPVSRRDEDQLAWFITQALSGS
jgi:hypothetical protein